MRGTLQIALCMVVVIQVATADLETPNGIFKTNCFTQTNNGECEDSRIKICHDYYACDLVIQFQSPIKRIGFIEDEILVAEGFNTYWIDDRKMEAKKIKKVIPPLNEYVDINGNKYYAGEGTTYVSHKESGKEIEIVTTGEYSFNQLAIDKEANILFILTFPSNNKERREGKLYGVDLELLKIVDDKVEAEMVEGDYNITALAVAGGLDRLLLGIRTEKGGNLVRLSRQKEDPCVVLKSPQNEIITVIKDAEKKLLQIFEENLILFNTRDSIKNKEKEDLKYLEERNAECSVQLQQRAEIYEEFTASMRSYLDSLVTSNSYLAVSDNSSFEIESHNNSADDYHKGAHAKECLPVEDIRFIRGRISELQTRERDLIEKLKKNEKDLREIISPKVLSLRIAEETDDSQIVFAP